MKKKLRKINFLPPFKWDIDSVPSTRNYWPNINNCWNIFRSVTKTAICLPFYSALPEEELKNLKQFALTMLLVFGSAYICEQAFSKMNYVKSEFRSFLIDDQLKSLLVIGTTWFEPRWKDILSTKQFQSSHQSKLACTSICTWYFDK